MEADGRHDMPAPAISVVMPVRNAMPWLDEAVDSILRQSFRDFEFVIGDDGSTDGSKERLREWHARDPRIRLVEHAGPPLGLVGSANWIARLARAPLVARMDADDISRSNRLERQIAIFEAHPDVVLVGSLWEGIDLHSRKVHGRDRSRLIQAGCQPFQHGSIAWRQAAFLRMGGYGQGTDHFEDSYFFRRMAATGRVLILAEPLYCYRWSTGSSHFEGERVLIEESLEISARWGKSEKPARIDTKTLERWRSEVRGGRVDPQVFLYTAYRRVWNGRSAGILLRLLLRGRLGLNRSSLHVLAWAVAGAVAPSALRAFVRFRMARRDCAAETIIGDAEAFEWPVKPARRAVR